MKQPTALASLLLTAVASLPSAARAGEERSLSIVDRRPVEAALLELAYRHNLHVSYEDVPFRGSTDVEDITDEVQAKVGADNPLARDILAPVEASLSLTYQVPNTEAEALDVVNALLAAHANAGNPGDYGVTLQDGWLHVYPKRMSDGQGGQVNVTSKLSMSIDVEADSGKCGYVLDRIVKRMDDVLTTTLPTNLLLRNTCDLPSASGQTVRQAMSTVLDQLPSQMVFTLRYDPGMDKHLLMVYAVPDPNNPIPPPSAF